ncbi:MAG: hypothetical protein M1541_19195, partial [Acidobacteria bacterium]|nr:hypothetical protein [Acidobacteriota bacterium]
GIPVGVVLLNMLRLRQRQQSLHWRALLHAAVAGQRGETVSGFPHQDGADAGVQLEGSAGLESEVTRREAGKTAARRRDFMNVPLLLLGCSLSRPARGVMLRMWPST